MAREIVLSNGMRCLVDDHNYEWLSQYKWTATHFYRKDENGRRKNKEKWYAARWESTSEYTTIKKGPNKGKKRKKQRKRYMHRDIMKTKAHHVCDHKDGNGLNNQEENLRNCTQRTNCLNRQMPEKVEWT